MSEPSLPDDLSRWPENPYELLGVSPGVSPIDLKRSYIRLIRRFKPEAHPEHFRRIREAYEIVLRSIEYFSRLGIQIRPADEDPPDTSAVPDTAPSDTEQRPSGENEASVPPDEPADVGQASYAETPEREAPVDPYAEPIRRRPAARSVVDQAADLWSRAIRGEEAEAYRGLCRLHEAEPNHSELCLRLYWLLALDPALDVDRQPCDWLVKALRQTGLRGPALELYRREIEANPREADTPRFQSLLSINGNDGIVAELYHWRWAALRTFCGWDALAADWPVAKSRFSMADESIWLRLVCSAADAAAWNRLSKPGHRTWDDVQREMLALAHLGTRYSEWFDQFEFLTAVRGDWLVAKSNENSPAELFDLIAAGWHAPWPDYQADFERLIEQMADDPHHWISLLRNVPASLIGAFNHLLRCRENELGLQQFRPSLERVARMTSEFVAGLSWQDGVFVQQALDYCCREGLDPQWMADALLANQVVWNTSFVEPELLLNLAEDWPVRCVCLAHRLFWS